MPETRYSQSIARAIVVDETLLRAIASAFANIGGDISIDVSFSDKTTTTFATIDDLAKIINAPSRKIQSIALTSRHPNQYSRRAEFKIRRRLDIPLENIDLTVNGEEADVVLCRRNVLEIVDNATTRYDRLIIKSAMAQGFLFGFSFSVIIFGVGGIAACIGGYLANKPADPLVILGAALALIVGSLPYFARSVLRKALPITVFRFGNEYEDLLSYRSMLVKAVGFTVAAVGLVASVATIVPLVR